MFVDDQLDGRKKSGSQVGNRQMGGMKGWEGWGRDRWYGIEEENVKEPSVQ